MKDDYKSGFLGQIILGTVVGLAITLAGVLIFALIIDAASLGDGVIKPVNQFIKARCRDRRSCWFLLLRPERRFKARPDAGI